MPLRQLFPDPKKPAGDAAKIYIIAVHGLNPRNKNDADHARDTWQTPSGSSGRLWLRDDLPESVPGARIFFYQYNSTAVYGKDRSTFTDKANELLETIRIEKVDEETVPIIFLAHSMGGLLVKQALINAHNNPKYTSIKTATKGLAFFATPHHGGDGKLVSLGVLATTIAQHAGFQKGDDVLQALKDGSMFSDIMQEHWRHQLMEYDIISFWGTLDKYVPRESARFGMPGDRENIVPLNADHGKVCKFGESQTDQDNWKLVRQNIKDIYKNAVKQRSSNPDANHPAGNKVISYPTNLLAPVKTFVERTSLAQDIYEQLHRVDESRKGQPKVVSIWGLGGAGKSQLALSYLQKHNNEYDATFWIQAGQIQSIDRDFLQIQQSLPRFPTLQPRPTNPEEVRQSVLSWFIKTTGKWLVLFDGADNLDKNDQDFLDLRRYIPRCANMHVLITSRSTLSRDLSLFEGVKVHELDEPQAIDLFFNCSQISRTLDETNVQVTKIVKELGHLALAITIAGAYVLQTPRLSSNLDKYLEEFRQKREEVLSEKPDGLMDDYSDSVMTVWETSFAAVSTQLPEAGRFLKLMAFIHYEDIFLDLFDTESKSDNLWKSVISTEKTVDIRMLEKCFAILERYCLLSRPANGVSYSIHRLVHAWDHDRLLNTDGDIDTFCLAAFLVLLKAVKICPASPIYKLRLAPHIRANFEKVSRLQLDKRSLFIAVIDELEIISRFTMDIGRLEDTAIIQRDILEKRKRILGVEHPDTISAMNNLANTLRDQGQLEKAAVIQQEVLEKRKRILGEEHSYTISAMNNLAATLGHQGQLEEAAAMQQEVLEKMKCVLGEEHPDTISVINNLAAILGHQGQLEEAAAMQQEVLEKRKRILGVEHPDTISTISNLAATFRDQGQLEEAAAIQQEVLEKRKRILGVEHPDTISAISNLAATFRDQGQLEEAAAMQQEVLEKRKRILGEEHPDTISAINNLAATLRDQGQLEEAAAIQQEVLEKRKRILGEEHPSTISAMHNLANTLRDQGLLEEAGAMKQEVLEKIKRILGEEHPSTLSAMNNLANILGDQGQLEEAAAMQQEVLEKRKRILGEEHPDTLSAINNLANTLGHQGQLEEAAAMKQEVLEKMKRILGKEHPSTLSAMNNLAATLGDQGQLEEAAAIKQEVLEKRKRILGAEHPDTISAMNNLANTLRDQGQLEEAAAIQQEVLEKRKRILGVEHPDTISTISNLAATLRDQGQLEEATAMQQEVLEKRKRILGEEHPSTHKAMKNLDVTLLMIAAIAGEQRHQQDTLPSVKEISRWQKLRAHFGRPRLH